MAKKNKILKEPEIAVMINWAIVSQLKPHQLAYRINEVCRWTMHRLKNLSANLKMKTPGFALYNYQQDDMQPDFYLIALKDDKNSLVKELKQFDYLLQARLPDDDTKWRADEIMLNVKSIENVLGVFEINIETIKNVNVLFFDKHLDELEIEPEIVKRIKMKRIVK